ncbi:unnamed protein product [Rotaria sp. Silwood1]|nr:unnamed protein product [Rotaria sp. Silwood1]CAF3517848.1 unnamed protein product [Rotaria sp. Silwood1]CAF4843514.1 unnamed protein product [Rotaria sp. Silwood1]
MSSDYDDDSDNVYNNNDEHFQTVYQSYSSAFLIERNQKNVENGGKIILPEAALAQLVEQTNVMLFKLTNPKCNRSTHCGVLEFIPNEDSHCFLPYWMMNYLLLNDGDDIHIESVHSLPVGTFVCFQPQSKDFLDISNPRAVLEHVLRNFSCLTKGDLITINYLNRNYELSVLELKPSNAVSIIECDIEVDFAPSIDTINDKKISTINNDEQYYKNSSIFMPFSGQGNSLNGKVKSNDKEQQNNIDNILQKRGIPNYDYKYGLLQFPRISLRSINNVLDKNSSNIFQPFKGEGKTLRQPRNQKPN